MSSGFLVHNHCPPNFCIQNVGYSQTYLMTTSSFPLRILFILIFFSLTSSSFIKFGPFNNLDQYFEHVQNHTNSSSISVAEFLIDQPLNCDHLAPLYNIDFHLCDQNSTLPSRYCNTRLPFSLKEIIFRPLNQNSGRKLLFDGTSCWWKVFQINSMYSFCK